MFIIIKILAFRNHGMKYFKENCGKWKTLHKMLCFKNSKSSIELVEKKFQNSDKQ